MDKNEIKKDLYKSKAMAKFSHYAAGKLYYEVPIAGKLHQFPIETTEKETFEIEDDNFKFDYMVLSSDLGTTAFGAEIKGSDLIRWIDKAIDKEEFVKISI